MTSNQTMAADAESKPAIHDVADEGGISYGSISSLAVCSLLLALISPLAIYGPQIWIVPTLSILAAIRAKQSIRDSEGTLSGSWLAGIALPLSLCFLCAGVARSAADRYYLLHGAAQVTNAYFRDLRHGDPHRAMQWETAVSSRRPMDELLWDYFRQDKTKEKQLRNWVEQPVIKTLLLLGERSDIRLYQTLNVANTDTQDTLSQLYAVTFDDSGKKKTFFLQVEMVRETDFGGPKHWRIRSMTGPVHPVALQG